MAIYDPSRRNYLQSLMSPDQRSAAVFRDERNLWARNNAADFQSERNLWAQNNAAYRAQLAQQAQSAQQLAYQQAAGTVEAAGPRSRSPNWVLSTAGQELVPYQEPIDRRAVSGQNARMSQQLAYQQAAGTVETFGQKRPYTPNWTFANRNLVPYQEPMRQPLAPSAQQLAYQQAAGTVEAAGGRSTYRPNFTMSTAGRELVPYQSPQVAAQTPSAPQVARQPMGASMGSKIRSAGRGGLIGAGLGLLAGDSLDDIAQGAIPFSPIQSTGREADLNVYLAQQEAQQRNALSPADVQAGYDLAASGQLRAGGFGAAAAGQPPQGMTNAPMSPQERPAQAPVSPVPVSQTTEAPVMRTGNTYRAINAGYEPNPAWMRRGSFTSIADAGAGYGAPSTGMPAYIPPEQRAPSETDMERNAMNEIRSRYAARTEDVMQRLSNARGGQFDRVFQTAMLNGLKRAEGKEIADLRSQLLEERKFAAGREEFGINKAIAMRGLDLKEQEMEFGRQRANREDARLSLAQQTENRKADTEAARIGIAEGNLQLARDKDVQSTLSKYIKEYFEDDPEGAERFRNVFASRLSQLKDGLPTDPAKRLELFEEVAANARVLGNVNAPGFFGRRPKVGQEGQLRLKEGSQLRSPAWADLLSGDTSIGEVASATFSGRAPNQMVQLEDGTWRSVGSLVSRDASGNIRPRDLAVIEQAAIQAGMSPKQAREQLNTEGYGMGAVALGAAGLASAPMLSRAARNKTSEYLGGSRDAAKQLFKIMRRKK